MKASQLPLHKKSVQLWLKEKGQEKRLENYRQKLRKEEMSSGASFKKQRTDLA